MKNDESIKIFAKFVFVLKKIVSWADSNLFIHIDPMTTVPLKYHVKVFLEMVCIWHICEEANNETIHVTFRWIYLYFRNSIIPAFSSIWDCNNKSHACQTARTFKVCMKLILSSDKTEIAFSCISYLKKAGYFMPDGCDLKIIPPKIKTSFTKRHHAI